MQVPDGFEPLSVIVTRYALNHRLAGRGLSMGEKFMEMCALEVRKVMLCGKVRSVGRRDRWAITYHELHPEFWESFRPSDFVRNAIRSPISKSADWLDVHLCAAEFESALKFLGSRQSETKVQKAAKYLSAAFPKGLIHTDKEILATLNGQGISIGERSLREAKKLAFPKTSIGKPAKCEIADNAG